MINKARQTRKRLATRQRISDVATRLFIDRGFDAVTVGEIAEAADVSRMTVFNHFARKEDMFFDVDEAGRDELLTALLQRGEGISPVEALRLFAHWAVAEGRPYARFFERGSERFMATLGASEALQARARAIRDELSDLLAGGLATCAGHETPDAGARLTASLVLATWTVAILEAHRAHAREKEIERATGVLLRLVDQGMRGVCAAMEGTAYVRGGPEAVDRPS